MRNFSETLKKDVTYDNLTVTKKQCFALCLEDTFLEKPQEGGDIDFPQPFYG